MNSPTYGTAPTSAQAAQAVAREEAPTTDLPSWADCAQRVENSDYIAKRIAEGGYGAEPDSLLASELHRFIYEYDDEDSYKSGWFRHRLALLIAEVARDAATVTATPAQPVADFDAWWARQKRDAGARGAGDEWMELDEVDRDQYRACWDAATRAAPVAADTAQAEESGRKVDMLYVANLLENGYPPKAASMHLRDIAKRGDTGAADAAQELIENLCSAAVTYGEHDTKEAEQNYYAAKAQLLGKIRQITQAASKADAAPFDISKGPPGGAS